jgi:hypothetical protein
MVEPPTDRPVLFLDVDGVLLPFGGPHPPVSGTGGDAVLSRLRPSQGRRLVELGCELVWATSWGPEANTELAPRLGLPALPVLEESEDDVPRGVHWKTAAVVRRAAGRPFVWVDDEIGDADRVWVRAAHPAPALLYRVDPRVGLTDGDVRTVGAWLAARTVQGNYWDCHYAEAPLDAVEVCDDRAVLDWVAARFPVVGSQVAWSQVTQGHTGRHVADDAELAALATAEVVRLARSGHAVEHAGDALSPYGVRFGAADVPWVLPALLEIPEHHYFAAADRSWLVVVTMEGDLDVVDGLV